MRSTPPADSNLSNLSCVICGLGEDIQPCVGPCFQRVTVVSHVRSQVLHVTCWMKLGRVAGQGDMIEVHGDEWKGFRVVCLLPADHTVNDITGCSAVSRWGNGDGRRRGVD